MTTPLRYAALGDSYTIGEGVDAAERFPMQLAAALRAEGFPLAEPEIVARTGWTTDELRDALGVHRLQGPFDLVSLLIGVNNQYRGWPRDVYAREFAELLDYAIGLAHGDPSRVLVLSIPDWGMTPFGKLNPQVSAEIDAFNALNREWAARRGAHYVDVTPCSRRAADDASMLAADELHPSGKMYAEWLALALPAARAALKQGRDLDERG